MLSKIVADREKLHLVTSPEASSQKAVRALGNLQAVRILTLALFRELEHLDNVLLLTRNPTLNLQEEVNRFEADLIRCALIQSGGRQRGAARLLGMKVTTLHLKVKRYKLDSPESLRSAQDLRLKMAAAAHELSSGRCD